MKLSGVLSIKKDAKKSASAKESGSHLLTSPLKDKMSPKLGFTLLHGEAPSAQYLMKVYSAATSNNVEVNLITITVPVFAFPPEIAAKVAGSLDKANLLQAEHLRIANISKDLRNDIVNRLIGHYEREGNVSMVERLSNVSSNMSLNQLCAHEPSVVDVIWDQNNHLAVVSHLAQVEGLVEEVSTMFRGGLDCTIVNRHGKNVVELPEICHRPILSLVRERALNSEQTFAL